MRCPKRSRITAAAVVTVGSPLKNLMIYLTSFREYGATGAVLLVDCLTLWLSNIMSIERDVGYETKALTAAISGIKGV